MTAEYNLINVLRTYDHRLRPKSGQFGIEVEVEGHNVYHHFGQNTNNIDPRWFVTGDGSLRGEGSEFVLIKPLDKTECISALDKLHDILHKHTQPDWKSGRCSIHVHLNMQRYTVNKLIKFCLLYYVLEPLIFEAFAKTRKHNFYCLSLNNAEGLRNIWSTLLDNKDLYVLNNIYKIRYAALNLTSIFKFGSLEFRFLGLSDDFNIKTTMLLNLLDNLLDYSDTFDTFYDLSWKVSMNGSEEFVDHVLDKNLSSFIKLQSGKEFNTLFFKGLRLVQDIFYNFDENTDHTPESFLFTWDKVKNKSQIFMTKISRKSVEEIDNITKLNLNVEDEETKEIFS